MKIRVKKTINNHVAVANMSFVLSYIDMAILFYAGCIHIISESHIKDLNLLKQYFTDNSITSTFILPSLLNELLPLDSLVYACVAGEKSNFEFSLFKTQVFNVYGSSESHVMSFCEYDNNKIGNFFGNGKVNLVDANNSKLINTDSNQPGEIVYSGPVVMNKYINDPILTTKAIDIESEKNEKIFHTNDVGR